MAKYLIPLILFLVLSWFLYDGLSLNPRAVPSPLINKPAPKFDLPQLNNPEVNFNIDSMKGKVWLLNVWASWCVSCRQEHPLLVQLSRSGLIPLYGLNYKDKPEDGRLWLRREGDPYVLSAIDADGRVGIDFGVYGVPETYLIDKNGVIAHKITGVFTPAALEYCVLPYVKLLNEAPADKQPTREIVPACI